MSSSGVTIKLRTPTKSRHPKPPPLRTPVFTPKTPLTFTPASALRTSASMATRSEDHSSPLLAAATHAGTNMLDPSLDLMKNLDPEFLDMGGVSDKGDNVAGISPSAIRQLALRTPNPPMDIVNVAMGEDSMVFGDISGEDNVQSSGRVLDFNLPGDERDEQDDVGDATIMDDFGESQDTDIGSYGLGAAIDIPSSTSPPPSDLVSWLRNAYDLVPQPYDEFTPKVLREDLYAHMARDLPPSATLPSKDQVANLVLEAFPGAKWQSHIDHGPNHVILGLQMRRSVPSRSLGQSSRHRYSNSCNLSDLANIAAYAHREMTQSTDARDSYSPTESQVMSPTAPNDPGPFGTPGRRSALDELAAAAALSERSPMAKGRRISYGDEQDGGKTKRRRVNPGKGVTVYPEAGSSRDGWNGQTNGEMNGGSSSGDEETATSRAPGKKKAGKAGKKSNGKGHIPANSGSGESYTSPPSMVSHVLPSSTSSGDLMGNGGASNRSKPSGKAKKNIYTNLAVTSSTDPNIKHYKPNFTYHELITHEIKRSSEGRLQLSEIYRRISERYPFFKLGEPGWQNSIRHNLSLKKCFVRVDRPNDAIGDKSGKGGWWTYVAQGDPDGRGGRKGLSGKGTGEYRKGQTPSDIASRSGSPDEGIPRLHEEGPIGMDDHEHMAVMMSRGYIPSMGIEFDTSSSRGEGLLVPGGTGVPAPPIGIPYQDQAQTLAMAAHVLNGYRQEQDIGAGGGYRR